MLYLGCCTIGIPAVELSSYLRPLVDRRGTALRRSDVDLVAGVHEHAVRGRRFLEPKAYHGDKTRVLSIEYRVIYVLV